MKKIAIIGASYLQVPLIKKAKEMGLETHVFAWKKNEEGEKIADFFYPVSIIEKEEILKQCKSIGISGICSIASDLATITVNYVANKLGLVGNNEKCTIVSTNKYEMRKVFEDNGLPSPKYKVFESCDELNMVEFSFPMIVKPTDRSGSRGVTKVTNRESLYKAYQKAFNESFEKKVIVEEYVSGNEYSVECISQNGVHHFLIITKKYTTGEPHFIETGHIQPGIEDSFLINQIKKIVFKALDSLGCQNGASHSEIKIDSANKIHLIEIGCRMGGDMIGSHLVELSTGIDYVKEVINVSLGNELGEIMPHIESYSGVKYIFNQKDFNTYVDFSKNNKSLIVEENIGKITKDIITDSSNRFGCYIVKSKKLDDFLYLFEN